MSSAPQFSSVPCVLNYMDYYESPTSVSNAPTITMRVNIHVMQKNDGSGSFVDDVATRAYLSGLFAVDNTVCPHTCNFTPYGHVEPATWQIDVGGIPVPFVTDAKIRFILTGIYFHQDDIGWDRNNQSSCGNYCYSNYAINPGVDLNIFFVNYSSGFGCGPGPYIIMGDRWDLEDVTDINNLWGIRTLLGHEIGHCLGLSHVGTWSGNCSVADDQLDDTPHPDNRPAIYGNCPSLVGPQSGCTPNSNNVMGYNGCQGYFSPKQIAKMRQTIQNQQKSFVECLYNSSANYSISTNTTWDASRIYDGNISVNSNSTLTVNCALYMPDGATITVESGSELIVNGIVTNLCSSAWNGTIDVKPGGILKLQSGAEVTFRDNGNIMIEDDLSSPARLVFDPGAKIYLDGYNTSIDIKGDLELTGNASFKFLRHGSQHGFVHLGNSSHFPSRNIIASPSSSIDLSGSSSNNKILVVDQETFYAPANLSLFKLSSGKVILNSDSRVQADGLSTAIDFNNVKFTSNTPGLNNYHRGLHLYGQPNVQIVNCIFEYGRYGIFAYQTYGGTPLNLIGCTFRHNIYGIRTYDKGLGLYQCNFFKNDFGVFAGQMAFPSLFYEGHVGGGVANMNTMGIKWQGYSTASLTLNDPYINTNRVGTRVENCPLYVKCGSISFNEMEGIVFTYGANLFMDDQVITPNTAANVSMVNNGYTIRSASGWYLWLNNGMNELVPSTPNNQRTVWGSLLSTPYGIIANQNQWNSTGNISSLDYGLTNPNGSSYNIIDNSPQSSISSCGQAIPPCPNPPCSNQSPIEYCPLCDIINSDDFSNVKLNIATKDAIAILNSTNPDKYIRAIDLFYQILIKDYINPDEKEMYLLSLNYVKLLEAFGNAYKYNQLACAEENPIQVNEVLLVQNKLIEISITNQNYPFRFKYSMDKAQILRLACKRKDCHDLLVEMLNWIQGEDNTNAVNKFICEIEIEMALLEGTIHLEDLEAELSSCNSSTERIRNEETSESKKLPKQEIELKWFQSYETDLIEVTSNIEDGQYELLNSLGQIVSNSSFNFETVINTVTLKSGIYILKVRDLKSNESNTEKVFIK